MGKTILEAKEQLERILDLTVPENGFWILRDYNNFHAQPTGGRGKEGTHYDPKTGQPGARRYLYSDGHVADYETI